MLLQRGERTRVNTNRTHITFLEQRTIIICTSKFNTAEFFPTTIKLMRLLQACSITIAVSVCESPITPLLYYLFSYLRNGEKLLAFDFVCFIVFARVKIHSTANFYRNKNLWDSLPFIYFATLETALGICRMEREQYRLFITCVFKLHVFKYVPQNCSFACIRRRCQSDMCARWKYCNSNHSAFEWNCILSGRLLNGMWNVNATTFSLTLKHIYVWHH